MVPSSFMISTITPAGWSPASRARSTQASYAPSAAELPLFGLQGEQMAGVDNIVSSGHRIDRA